MAVPVLVMGATGNVGGATLTALREAGLEAVAFVRNRDRAAEQLGADQPVRVGDLADTQSVVQHSRASSACTSAPATTRACASSS